jgi:hypothetical protein
MNALDQEAPSARRCEAATTGASAILDLLVISLHDSRSKAKDLGVPVKMM